MSQAPKNFFQNSIGLLDALSMCVGQTGRSACTPVCGVPDARMDHDADSGGSNYVFRCLSGPAGGGRRLVRAAGPLSD